MTPEIGRFEVTGIALLLGLLHYLGVHLYSHSVPQISWCNELGLGCFGWDIGLYQSWDVRWDSWDGYWVYHMGYGLWACVDEHGTYWHIFWYCWRSSGKMGDVFGMFNEVFCISLRQIQWWNVAIPGPWLHAFPLGWYDDAIFLRRRHQKRRVVCCAVSASSSTGGWDKGHVQLGTDVSWLILGKGPGMYLGVAKTRPEPRDKRDLHGMLSGFMGYIINWIWFKWLKWLTGNMID